MRWFVAGIELCLDTGDPESLVPQLLDLREASLSALGRAPDGVQERGDRFLLETKEREGFRPAQPLHPHEANQVARSRTSEASTVMAVGWFSRDELAAALERWPDLRERLELSSYEEYARAIQRLLIDMGRVDGKRPRLAPLRVDDLESFADSLELDPVDASTRSRWAAELARRGDSLPWPPGRNDRCWCGSGTKYKRCCGNIAGS